MGNDYCQEFLDSYLENGFGSLSKKEVDRLVFALMTRSGRIVTVDDHFAISRQLKISLPRAANLAYEFKLHYESCATADQLRKRFGELIRHTNLGRAKNKVALEVRDRILREEIEQQIQTLRLVAPDYTFNRNLLILDYSTFSALVAHFAGAETMAKIEAELKKHKDLPKGLPSAQELFSKFVEHVAIGAGDAVGERIVDFADLVITGGLGSIANAIRKALR